MKRPISGTAAVAGQTLLLLCTLAVIWGVIGYYLRAEYTRTVQNAVERSATLARSLEQNMTRSATVLDTALVNARTFYLGDKANFKIGPWMRDKAVLMRIAVQMSIADATGTIVTSSGDNGPPPVNIADREHFRVQAGAPGDQLFISKPLIGRNSGRLSIQFTRRVVNPDGSFAGVVVVSFDPSVINDFQDGTQLNGGFTMLIGGDGIIRAARPDAALVGTAFPRKAILETINEAGDGPLANGTQNVIGDEAIVSYRKIDGFPLFVAAGFPRAAVLALYDSECRITVLAGLVLSLIVLLTGVTTILRYRRLARFHEALTITLDNISQGILMVDARRRVRVVNGRGAELLGLPVQLAVAGVAFDDIVKWQTQLGELRSIPDGDQGIATLLGRGAIDRSTAFYERTRPNGTVLEVRTTLLPGGGAVRTYTDITERKRIESEMARARDEAEAGVRARTEFLAIVSHEIRTPMNGIVGAAGLLRDMRLDTQQTEYVRVICESSEHLSLLIQDILDFSRLDSGRFELEDIAFEPRVLIQGTIAMLRGQAKAKGLTLTACIGDDIPDSISGDPSRLRQILVNLISNGIKFTNAGGVTVDARVAAAGALTVTLGIKVADTGIGIDPGSTQKLFSAFTQVDSSISRRFGGTGLGLAICKRLINLMGGEIAVDSVTGQGSTFHFDVQLRRVPAEQPAAAAAPVATIAPRHLKVLLAEDNPTNRFVAMRMLARMGHTVDAVEDGARAVSAAAAGEYDVILMDMMMPGVDGLAATRMIRAGAPPRRHIRIVGLTANALASDRVACEEAGMDGFVTKPVTLDQLRAALEQTILQHNPESGQPRYWDAIALDARFLSNLADDIGQDCAVEVIRAFLEDAPGYMAAIEQAMASGAIQNIRREAHVLAGACGNVGLVRLAEAAGALRTICGQALPGRADIEIVAAAFREALPLVAAWADAHEVEAAEGTSAGPV